MLFASVFFFAKVSNWGLFGSAVLSMIIEFEGDDSLSEEDSFSSFFCPSLCVLRFRFLFGGLLLKLRECSPPKVDYNYLQQAPSGSSERKEARLWSSCGLWFCSNSICSEKQVDFFILRCFCRVLKNCYLDSTLSSLGLARTLAMSYRSCMRECLLLKLSIINEFQTLSIDYLVNCGSNNHPNIQQSPIYNTSQFNFTILFLALLINSIIKYKYPSKKI